MRRIFVLLLAVALSVGALASPAGAAHDNDLAHWGHGHVPTVHGPPNLSPFAYHAERTWIDAGYRNGFRVGPWSYQTTCNPVKGGIVYCWAPSSELSAGAIGTASVWMIYNPNLHIDRVVLRICSDCGLTWDQIRRVVTHELGHGLGLGHSPNTGSVMFRQLGSGQPDAHDRHAIRVMYNGHNEG